MQRRGVYARVSTMNMRGGRFCFMGRTFYGENFSKSSPHTPLKRFQEGDRGSVFKATDGMFFVGAVGYSVEIADMPPDTKGVIPATYRNSFVPKGLMPSLRERVTPCGRCGGGVGEPFLKRFPQKVPPKKQKSRTRVRLFSYRANNSAYSSRLG